LSTASRLVIDCNRHLDADDLIPEISDGTLIPGNRGLNAPARAARIERWFTPYHQAVDRVLTTFTILGLAPMVLSIHSMAATMAGCRRPWQMALSCHRDRRYVEPMLAALRRRDDVTVGDNQPYELDPAVDFSIPYHAMRRNLPYLQVEFRQDEVADSAGQENWARRFAAALAEIDIPEIAPANRQAAGSGLGY
jgi:predicted N-formylglutamate amidohydrolase